MHSFSQCPKLRKALRSAIEKGSPQATLALESLGALGHEEDIPFIKHLLPVIQFTESAFLALGYSKNRGLVPFCAQYLVEPKNPHREYAAWCLGEVGDAESVPHLVDAIRDPVRMVSYYAAKALFRMAVGAKTIPEFDLPIEDADEWLSLNNIDILFKLHRSHCRDLFLKKIPKIENPRLLASIISCFNSFEPDEEVNDFLIKSLSHGDARVRANAIEALGNKELTTPEKSRLFTPFLQDLDNRSCANAIVQLYPILGEVCHRQLLTMLNDMGTNWTLSAIFVLGKLGTSPSDFDGNPLFNHAVPRIRSHAIRMLGGWSQFFNSGRIVVALQDKDPWVRKSSLELLLASPRDITLTPPLAELLKNESHSQVLLAYLNLLNRQPALQPREEENLLGAAKSADPQVRLSAIAQLGRRGCKAKLLGLRKNFEKYNDESAGLFHSYLLEWEFTTTVQPWIEKLSSSGNVPEPLLKGLIQLGKRIADQQLPEPSKKVATPAEKEEGAPGGTEDFHRVNPKVVADGTPQSLVQEGDYCFKQGLFKDGQFYYKKFLKQFPDDTQVRYKLAVCYYKMERIRDCELELRGVVKQDPQLFEARLLLGNLFLKEKKWEAVIEILEPVKNPDKLDTLTYLGLAYFNRNEFPKAIDCFRAVLQKQPDSVNSAYQLGMCYYQTKQYQRAATQFEHVHRLAPPGSRMAQTVADFLQKLENLPARDQP